MCAFGTFWLGATLRSSLWETGNLKWVHESWLIFRSFKSIFGGYVLDFFFLSRKHLKRNVEEWWKSEWHGKMSVRRCVYIISGMFENVAWTEDLSFFFLSILSMFGCDSDVQKLVHLMNRFLISWKTWLVLNPSSEGYYQTLRMSGMCKQLYKSFVSWHVVDHGKKKKKHTFDVFVFVFFFFCGCSCV